MKDVTLLLRYPVPFSSYIGRWVLADLCFP